MADNSTGRTGGCDNTNVGLWMTPAAGYSLWGPALAGAASWNASLYERFARLGSEWLDFVNRRLKEDLSFPQRLCASRSPEEVRQAYLAFWQQAVEDYQKEATVMTGLAGGLADSDATPAQSRAGDAARIFGGPYSEAA